MQKIGRNEPCPCGSGQKAKRCCGVPRGPAEDQLERARLAVEADAAASCLVRLDEDELDALWDEMLGLPEWDLSLHFPLPLLVTPDLQRLIEAMRDEADDEADDALQSVLDEFDTPAARAALTRAVIALRDHGLLGPQLAAIAILDLASRSQALLRESIAEAAAVAAGLVSTPGGLIVAPRLAA